MPDQPYQSPATVPPVAAVPPAVAYVPPPAAPKKSSSAWVVIVLAIVLVLGGGAAAAIVGFKMYKNWATGHALTADATTTTATSSASAMQPPAPKTGQLLSAQEQGVPQTGTLSTSNAMNTSQQAAPASTTPASSTPATTPAPSLQAQQQVSQSSTMPRNTRDNSPVPVVTRPAAVEPARPAHRASGVAIAVTGDANLVNSVADVITSELSSAGLKTVNADTLPSTENLVRSDAAASRLISRLRDEGYAVMLLARVDPATQRELHYMGRYDTAYSSKVTLTAYDLASGRPFGTPQRGTIEYTSVNADKKVDEVVGRLARASAEEIQGH